MVFGTFDVLHKGHLNFFKQARALSKKPYLIVSVARDINVKRIKGTRPRSTEKQRLALIKKCQLVDKAVLGAIKSHIPHITREFPDIISLGYDQHAYVGNLKNLLKKAGLQVKVIRLKAFYPKIYKSSLFKSL
jgi:cytidyltransferase-like protein